MDYSEYISKFMFSIAELEGSGFYYIDEPINNRAIGYYKHNDIWYCNMIKPVVRGTGAEGCFSTVVDLTKFMKSLLNGKLLDDNFKNIILSSKPNVISIDYGYGFFVKDDKIFHSGDGTGISANLSYYLKGNYIRGYTLSSSYDIMQA